MAPLAPLTRLVHHRWTLAVLARLHRDRGAKFVTLTHATGASPESIRRTLAALLEMDLVMKNPGYGHPMRPEYILTPRGTHVAPAVALLVRACDGHEAALFKKWSLPALASLADQPAGFNAIKRALHGATSRALSITLKDLELEGMIRRRVADSHPPTVTYELLAKGRKLAALTIELAKQLAEDVRAST